MWVCGCVTVRGRVCVAALEAASLPQQTANLVLFPSIPHKHPGEGNLCRALQSYPTHAKVPIYDHSLPALIRSEIDGVRKKAVPNSIKRSSTVIKGHEALQSIAVLLLWQQCGSVTFTENYTGDHYETPDWSVCVSCGHGEMNDEMMREPSITDSMRKTSGQSWNKVVNQPSQERSSQGKYHSVRVVHAPKSVVKVVISRHL